MQRLVSTSARAKSGTLTPEERNGLCEQHSGFTPWIIQLKDRLHERTEHEELHRERYDIRMRTSVKRYKIGLIAEPEEQPAALENGACPVGMARKFGEGGASSSVVLVI
ncbi:hypothetical protein AVEN_118135-1 [Araneus ventricosus]|uniref:Uncharacterized protein n=1 Tax=Araneus ventricosus TaxID=182803 RepID=A0A4Y2NSU5_ARAVE|nr:hypothetical protein AVEN_118135-1 [Araneus ventricosus]